MMTTASETYPATETYAARRGALETYFDRTAFKAWEQLTSDAPVSKIRETVRAGRDRMRATLLSWLPADLSNARVFDAGCGTGALAVEAAKRGAHVTGVDVSASLVDIAAKRAPADLIGAHLRFEAGDMLDPAWGRFDHAVAMDSLIHYRADDILRVLGALAERIDRSIVFTVAPRTPLLSVMHAVGKLFPRGDRAPAIEPVSEARIRRGVAATPALADWRVGRTQFVQSGFYTSLAIELVREGGAA